MSSDVIHAAMSTWAAKDLPARLHAAQVAKILNCTTDDVAILASAGKLRALGRPRPNAVKLFSTIELFTLLADREWLDEATKTIGHERGGPEVGDQDVAGGDGPYRGQEDG